MPDPDEESTRLANRPNGDEPEVLRDTGGRFAVGTKGGPGNPHAKRASELRRRLSDALTQEATKERLIAVVRALLSAAEAGDTQAAKIVLDRVSPIDAVVALRIEAIEKTLGLANDDAPEDANEY